MSTTTYVEQAMKELDTWEQNLTQFLSNSGASPLDIQKTIDLFQSQPAKFHELIKTAPEIYRGYYNAIIALSHIRALKQEIVLPLPEQVPTEDAARIALMFFDIGLCTGLSEPHAAAIMMKQRLLADAGLLKQKHEPFDKRGKTAKTTRAKSPFTDVMKHLFQLCIDKGKGGLLEPGNIDGFMKFAQEVIKDNNNQDQYIAERINSVKIDGSSSYFNMQVRYGRSKPKNGIDANKYPRIEIQKKLSALRNKNSQPVK